MKSTLTLVLAALLMGAPTGGIAGGKACPPGLAKKSPSCVPPGHAKRGGGDDHDDDRDRRHDRDGRYDRDRRDDRDRREITLRDLRPGYYYVGRDGRVYRVGDRLGRDSYIPLTARELSRLPNRRDGYRYVRIDNQVLEVATATDEMVRALGTLADLLN